MFITINYFKYKRKRNQHLNKKTPYKIQVSFFFIKNSPNNRSIGFRFVKNLI